MKTINLILINIIVLLFPLSGRAATEPDWNCDIHAYQYDMSVYFLLQQNDKLLIGDKLIAAFCKEECRGIAELQSNNNTSYYFIRVRSNQEAGDSIYFKVYDRETEKVQITSGSLSFENLKQTGYPSQPWRLTLPVVIKPEDDGELDQVTETTEVLQLVGQWTSANLTKLSEKIHKEENGELVNTQLSSVDMSEATLADDISLNAVFAGCSSLTSVKLPNLSLLKSESPNAFRNTNPNCLVFTPNNANIPEQWYSDVNVVANGVTELLILRENSPFRTPQVFKAKQAIFERRIDKKNNLTKSTPLKEWRTICLPFPVASVISGTEHELIPVSPSGDTYSGDFHIATITDRGFELIANRQESAPYLNANTPYLLNMISPKGNRTEGMVTFKSNGEVTIEVSNSSYTSEHALYDITGVFEPVGIAEGIYRLDESGSSFINSGNNILPFEAYLHPKMTPLPTSIPMELYSAVSGIQISPKSVSIEEGKTMTLTTTIFPEDATNTKVKWSSNNESIAMVSAQGVVSGVKEGIAIITIETEEGSFTATCSVTVTKSSISPAPIVKVSGITISPNSYTLNIGETIQMSAIIQPTDATNKQIEWSSSNTSVASISSTGLVSGLKTGNTIITVKTEDGGFKADSHITIINQATSTQDVEEKSIRICPTVVSSSFTISGLQGEGIIELFSYAGQVVKVLKAVESSFSVNTSDLQSGHYLVKVTQNNRSYTFKIIKKQ